MSADVVTGSVAAAAAGIGYFVRHLRNGSGNGKATETVLLLREIRDSLGKVADNTTGVQGFIAESRSYFIEGRRAIDTIRRMDGERE